MNTVGTIRDPIYLKHSNGPMHPEGPQRLLTIDGLISTFPGRDQLVDLPPRDASIDELARIHEPEYIRRIESTQEREFTVLDPDTSATSDSWAAAVRAAGGALAAVEAVLEGKVPSAFAFVRPPGHHAEADRAMGFCLFNNVAVAAASALERSGLERILIVDWDVHHGNGTMHSFYETDRVMYLSIHQYPHYPGTGRIDEIGAGAGRGYTVNVPLHGGQGDADYLYVFRELFAPIVRQYSPELILVSAGFDTHENDPLAGMGMSGGAYGQLTAILQQLAARCCDGRLVFTLEGGYDQDALRQGVAAVLSSLIRGAETTTSETTAQVSGETVQVVAELRRVLSPFWMET